VKNADPYLSEFGTVLLFLVGGIVFLGVTLLLSKILRPHKPNPDKLSTYESGEEAIGSSWPQFNIRFYVVALMFILFEIELIFLFPWATIFTNQELMHQTNNAWGWFTLVEVLTFVLILVLGLAYAWGKGYFDWTEGKQEIPSIHSPVPKDFYEQLNERYKSN
jgi:NADH-quinone oxidoreductase subunit A